MAIAKEKRAKIGASLRNRGFDQSYYDKDSGAYRVKCSQCEALCINGTATHEHGCPNQTQPSRPFGGPMSRN